MSGKISLFLSVAMLIAVQKSIAQKIIKGIVKNEQHAVLPSASVFLYDQYDNLLAVKSSSSKGEYLIETNSAKRGRLVFSYLGYRSDTLDLISAHPNSDTIIYNPVLMQKHQVIDEVIIRADEPVLISGDTIVYDVASFLKGNESVVEDLLKKLPGISVTEEGIVKFGDKEIEKIMVDGDDFFRKGYRLISKNMPPHPLDKVELIQRYSENSLLKGIEESEKVALNLTLKEDSKGVWFGNAAAAADVLAFRRYETNLNLMNFKPAQKYYFLQSSNNTGKNTTGDLAALRAASDGEMGQGVTVRELLQGRESYISIGRERYNFNDMHTFSANSIYTLAEKTKLKISALINRDKNRQFLESIQSYTLPDTSFVNTEGSTNERKNWNIWVKTELEHYFSPKTFFSSRTVLDYNGRNGMNDFSFNGRAARDSLTNSRNTVNQDFLLTHKLRDSSAVQLKAKYIFENLPQSYSSNLYLYQDVFPELNDGSSLAQQVDSRMHYAGVQLHFLNRKRNLFEVMLGNDFRLDKMDSRFQIFRQDQSSAQPAGYTNLMNNRTNDLYIGSKYSQSIGNLNASSQIFLHSIHNDLDLGYRQTSNHSIFLVPNVHLRWYANTKNTFDLDYLYSTTNAEPENLYSNYIQTSFRLFSRNRDDWYQLYRTNLSLRFRHGNLLDNFKLNASLAYSKDHNYLTTSSMIDRDVVFTDNLLLNGRESVSAGTKMENFLGFMAHNLTLDLDYRNSRYNNIVNNSDTRRVLSQKFDVGVELKSGFISPFNYKTGYRKSLFYVRSSSFNSVTNDVAYLNAFYSIAGIHLSANMDYYRFGNVNAGGGNYTFVDLAAKYNLLQDKMSLELSAKNLTNVTSYGQIFVSDIGFSESRMRLLPRYALLRVEYKF